MREALSQVSERMKHASGVGEVVVGMVHRRGVNCVRANISHSLRRRNRQARFPAPCPRLLRP